VSGRQGERLFGELVIRVRDLQPHRLAVLSRAVERPDADHEREVVHLEEAAGVLAVGRQVRGRGRQLLRGALRHALAFSTWRSLPTNGIRRSDAMKIAGVSLIELAIAFVVTHPAVSSAIIRPRTMDQLDSQLPAADVGLDAAVLDRSDEIVRPGVNLNPADTGYGEHVLKPPLRRR
jgi:aryl-alcohol dehydrogenase-like predicted oxidoreductase